MANTAARHEDVVPATVIPLASIVSRVRRLRRHARVLLHLRRRVRRRIRAGGSLRPPVALLLGVAFLAGSVLLLSALNVRYRDVRKALPFLIQTLALPEPGRVSDEQLGPRVARLLTLNPLVGIIDGVRWSLIGTNGPSPAALACRDRDLTRRARRRPRVLRARRADDRRPRVTWPTSRSAPKVSASGIGSASASRRRRRSPSPRDRPASPLAASRGAADSSEGLLGASRRLVRGRGAARSSASSDATAPGSRRSSRSWPASPSRPKDAPRCADGSDRCSRWERASIRS